MSKSKPATKSGYEYDWVHGRRYHKFGPGVGKYTKRCMNKRFRRLREYDI